MNTLGDPHHIGWADNRFESLDWLPLPRTVHQQVLLRFLAGGSCADTAKGTGPRVQ